MGAVAGGIHCAEALQCNQVELVVGVKSSTDCGRYWGLAIDPWADFRDFQLIKKGEALRLLLCHVFTD